MYDEVINTQKQSFKCFFKIVVRQNLSIFKGKYLCRGLFLVKLQP